MSDKNTNEQDKAYVFGGVKEYSLEQIEEEVLNESLYLDVFAGSDIRLKKEITSVENSLDKLLKIKAVNWKWNQEDYPERKFNTYKQVGFIAQDLSQVIPEIVAKDDSGHLAINYSKMTPFLTEAVKELYEITQKQQKEIELLKLTLNKNQS